MRSYQNINDDNRASVMALLSTLSAPDVTTEDYREAFHNIGRELGRLLGDSLRNIPEQEVMFAFANEDADWLGRGVMEGGMKQGAKVSVYWNSRKVLLKKGKRKIEIAPIVKSYEEPIEHCRVLLVVKSIISTSCVVKTQLTRLIGHVKPERIFVVAPVMFEDSEERLKKEFPKDISMKFTFRTFAVDNEKKGNNIIPGIGGQVYGRLGLGDGQTKNRYTPELVIHRMSL